MAKDVLQTTRNINKATVDTAIDDIKKIAKYLEFPRYCLLV